MYEFHLWDMVIPAAITLGAIKLVSFIFSRIERRINSVNLRFTKRIIYGFIICVGVICCLGSFVNLDKLLTTIWAGSGIAALAISLASQESLSNIIAGFLIVVFHPFDLGDKVFLRNSGISGFIEDITFRHTVIRTVSNSRITIPNSAMNKELIENYQLVEERSSSFMDIVIEYGSNVSLAKEVLASIICNNPLVIDTRTHEDRDKGLPQIEVFIRELTDSGIALRASVWTRNVNENFKACSMIREEILSQFAKEHIELAFTTYTVHVRGEQ